MENRGLRCRDGFLRGLCPVATCEHWDGVRNHREAAKTIKHEAWGKRQRVRRSKKAETKS